MVSHRSYLITLFCTLAVLRSPAAATYLWLKDTGELSTIPEVVERQQRTGAIYGTGLHGNEFEHRLELVKARTPEIMALGSSRSLAFRQEYFSRPFTCACLVAHDLVGVSSFLAALPANSMPSTIILTVDYWWFLDDYGETPAPIRPRTDSTALNLGKLSIPARWLAEGKVSLGELTARRGDRAPTISIDRIGSQAWLLGRGYRADGSLLDGYVLHNTGLSYIAGFTTNIASIRAGAAPWQHGRLVPERLQRLRAILTSLRGQGIKVVTILPPFPGRVMAELEANPAYDVLRQVRAAVTSLEGEVYDFTDGRDLGSDCEYLDGRHGGDVVYMRMLRQILRRNPHSALVGQVDQAGIEQEIERSRARL